MPIAPETDTDLFAASFVRSCMSWYSRLLEVTSKLFRPFVPWIFGLMFLWMALALVPVLPQIPATGLDGSWAHALNVAHAHNLVFGRDVIFTFGPLGYLFYPVPGLVAAFPAFAWGWAVYALFLFGLLLIWRTLGHCLIAFLSWAV